MSVILAVKTLEKIAQYIEKDQGAKFRTILKDVIMNSADAFRGEEEVPFREHLGASLIGSPCGRALWYGFRWAKVPKFRAHIVRLFNRGHLEEARFIALLQMIGCKIYQHDENGKQYRIHHAQGHFGGSGDGVAVGIPDLDPNTPALLEFKTHNDRSFREVKTEGIKSAKLEHYVQMNIYMYKMGLAAGLYLAVNKNNDELYGEIISLDGETAQQFLERGEKIVGYPHAPDKLSNSISYYRCRFCDYKGICHNKEPIERNCRTCKNSRPGVDKSWFCDVYKVNIPVKNQLTGCPDKYEPVSQ